MNFRNFLERIQLIEEVRIPVLGGMWYRLISWLDCRCLMKARFPEHPLNDEPRSEKIICSMTSYPARIEYVWIALKSLLLQSCKPERVLLWLAEEQFPDRVLPQSLLNLQRYGVEICWCHDLYGHKKFFFPVKEQKSDEVVITFDDDIAYAPDCIRRLMATHRQFPGCVVCERAQALTPECERMNPGRWKTLSDIGVSAPSYGLNPSPGGGCLIPYRAFPPEATDESLIRKYAYKNDDLWYMFMCAENGTKIIKTHKCHRIFTIIAGTQTSTMAAENVVQGKNAAAMERLMRAFPKAARRILSNEED